MVVFAENEVGCDCVNLTLLCGYHGIELTTCCTPTDDVNATHTRTRTNKIDIEEGTTLVSRFLCGAGGVGGVTRTIPPKPGPTQTEHSENGAQLVQQNICNNSSRKSNSEMWRMQL